MQRANHYTNYIHTKLASLIYVRTCYGHGDHPGEHDVPEERPVDDFLGADAADHDDGADLAVRRADGDAQIGRAQNRHGRTDLDGEAAGSAKRGLRT